MNAGAGRQPYPLGFARERARGIAGRGGHRDDSRTRRPPPASPVQPSRWRRRPAQPTDYPDKPGRYATDVPGMNYDAASRRAVRQLPAVHVRPWPLAARRWRATGSRISGRRSTPASGWRRTRCTASRNRRAVPEAEVGGAGARRPADGVPRRAGLAAGHADGGGLLPRLSHRTATIHSDPSMYGRRSWAMPWVMS